MKKINSILAKTTTTHKIPYQAKFKMEGTSVSELTQHDSWNPTYLFILCSAAVKPF